jgi:hypothetical protein
MEPQLSLVISSGPPENPNPILVTSDPTVIRATLEALKRRCFPGLPDLLDPKRRRGLSPLRPLVPKAKDTPVSDTEP